MKEIDYKSCTSNDEILGIRNLQKENHYSSLSREEMSSEGFLTCTHSIELLNELNTVAPHVIAIANNKVIAYLLTMTARAKGKMPILNPMFAEFETLLYKGQTIAVYNYLIVGQVCVAKGFRGKGVLNKCYELYKDLYSSKYDFAITEVDSRNKRSLKAHFSIGFQEIHRYNTAEGEEWSVVIWDWK